MPRIRYIGGYTKYLQKKEKQVLYRVESPKNEDIEDSEDSEDSGQTFPVKTSTVIYRQTSEDLTCGLCSIQNMYGNHFIQRDEMDNVARKLQLHSHGIELFNYKGYYAIEVLEPP